MRAQHFLSYHLIQAPWDTRYLYFKFRVHKENSSKIRRKFWEGKIASAIRVEPDTPPDRNRIISYRVVRYIQIWSSLVYNKRPFICFPLSIFLYFFHRFCFISLSLCFWLSFTFSLSLSLSLTEHTLSCS